MGGSLPSEYAFHHDVGMSCSSSEIERLEEKADFQSNRRLLEEFVVPDLELIGADPTLRDQQIKTEYLRWRHGPRCVDWVREHYSRESADAFIGTVYPWDAVAAVSLGHTLTFRQLQTSDYVRRLVIAPEITVDALFLTCLLRLADICHMSWDRALPYIRKRKVFSSGFSAKIWEKEGEIAGVASDPDTGTIIVRATPTNFERHRLIDESVQGISNELLQLHKLLSRQPGRHNLPWKYVDDSQVRCDDDAGYLFEPEGRFRLIEERIVELLMGSRLYAQPLYAVRECLQNAADAIRVHQLMSPHVRHRVVIQFREAEGSPGYLEIFDSGTGMDRDICLNHLLSVGAEPFSRSKRRFEEWGSGAIPRPVIAQHGIGFLSCFMIAGQVDVFSRYPDQPPVHLRLDSPTRLGEFSKTPSSEFPTWAETLLEEPSPWAERHGTCIRIHLREPLSKQELMSFLAQNILRMHERIHIIWGEECVELPEVWGQTDRVPGKALTLLELKETLFEKKEIDTFYDGPPKDPALAVCLHEEGPIRGRVRVSHEAGGLRRVSQEGILIRDGVGSLLTNSQTEHTFPFDFDIDVAAPLTFELDAERARITASPKNQPTAQAVMQWIEDKGLASIESVSAGLYFPCGGTYYHGGVDLLSCHGDPVVSFHTALGNWYTLERLSALLAEGKFDSVARARLYAAIGSTRNTPLSTEDLRGGGYSVLVPRLATLCGDGNMLSVDLDFDRDEEDGFRPWVAEQLYESVSHEADFDRVVYLPGFPETFSLPLSFGLEFEWSEVSPWALLGRATPKPEYSAPRADEIRAAFEAHGGFTSAEALADSYRRHREREDTPPQ